MLLSAKWVDVMRDVIDELPAPVYAVSPELAERVTGYHVHRGALASMQRKPLPDGRRTAADAPAGWSSWSRSTTTPTSARSSAAPPPSAWTRSCSPRTAPTPSTAARVKVSMGAVFSVPYARLDTWPQGPGVGPRGGLQAPRPHPRREGHHPRRGGPAPAGPGRADARRGGRRPVHPGPGRRRRMGPHPDGPRRRLAQRGRGGRGRLLRGGDGPPARAERAVRADVRPGPRPASRPADARCCRCRTAPASAASSPLRRAHEPALAALAAAMPSATSSVTTTNTNSRCRSSRGLAGPPPGPRGPRPPAARCRCAPGPAAGAGRVAAGGAAAAARAGPPGARRGARRRRAGAAAARGRGAAGRGPARRRALGARGAVRAASARPLPVRSASRPVGRSGSAAALARAAVPSASPCASRAAISLSRSDSWSVLGRSSGSFARQARTQRRQRVRHPVQLRLLVHHAVQHHLGTAVPEGRVGRRRVRQRGAEREDVRGRGDRRAAHLLGREEAGRADRRADMGERARPRSPRRCRSR